MKLQTETRFVQERVMNLGSFENLAAQIGCGVSGVGYKRELNFILYVVGMLLQGSE